MKVSTIAALLTGTEAVFITETLQYTALVTVFGGEGETLSFAPKPTATAAPAAVTSDIEITIGGQALTFTVAIEGNQMEFVNPAAASSQIAAHSAAFHHTFSRASHTHSAAAPSSTAVDNFAFSAPESSSVAVIAVTTSEAPPAPTTTSAAAVTSSAPSSDSSGDQSGNTDVKSSNDPDFSAVALDYHNKVRAIHQAPAVVYDQSLADYAANYLAGSNCVFAHSGGPYGENIALGYPNVLAAMEAWYDENSQYDYSAAQFGENTGHFTQMVWKSTGKIGCATIDCSGSIYLACEYSDDRGNVIGQFAENVLPAA